ncbi:hypothetical protein HRI_004137200 [Hibiscus trionum]|uniref:Uncharacterized protein n=1 Tax=Hibiscus trionum TaxID=183268 RepID=A0A9W7IZE1_HIBTR|nr:hypothetical protein HRI_004137200 [Hibiscus trionum]
MSILLLILLKPTAEGLKYYDIVEGKGPIAEKGATVQLHYDCIHRGITIVSSRESKLLAGNRIIAPCYIAMALSQEACSLISQLYKNKDYLENIFTKMDQQEYFSCYLDLLVTKTMSISYLSNPKQDGWGLEKRSMAASVTATSRRGVRVKKRNLGRIN